MIKSNLVADLFTLIGCQPYDPITGEKKPPGKYLHNILLEGFMPPKPVKKAGKGKNQNQNRMDRFNIKRTSR